MCEHSTSLKMEGLLDGKLKMKLNWMRKFDCGRWMDGCACWTWKLVIKRRYEGHYETMLQFSCILLQNIMRTFFFYVTFSVYKANPHLKAPLFSRILSDIIWDKLEDLRTDIHGHIHSWTPPKKHKQAEGSHATFTENEIYWLYPVVIVPSLPSLVTFL